MNSKDVDIWVEDIRREEKRMENYMLTIGIDIGGMSSKIGIVQDNRVIRGLTIKTSSDMDYNSFIIQVIDIVEELIVKEEKDIDRIGISSCGLIDSSAGKITYSNNIKWKDKSIVADLKEHFGVSVRIANDAKCALLAEATLGAGKDYDRVCMITLGTGVGGGFITGKKLDIGTSYSDASGILGHVSVVAGGRQCTCGHRGCLEAYASSTALMASYQSLTNEELSTKEIFDRVRKGEPTAVSVFDEFKYYLGEGLVSIGNILRPEIIVIGGGVSGSADLFTDYLEDYMNERIYGGNTIPVRVVAAKLGNDAGMIGATLL